MTYRTWMLAFSSALVALAQIETPKPVSYKDTIKPLLARSCLGCHNAQVHQSGFDLSSGAALMKGSENGPVIVPGNPTASTLYKVVNHSEQPAMPFKSAKLPAADIERIAAWIREGAVLDGEGNGDAVAKVDHWSFRPIAKPAVPDARGNPIDSFLEAERASRKLKAAPEADARTLLRRVYLDLTGLTPGSDEVTAFLSDKSPQAYERLVDRLLASPRYGERWGRHWLDVWRYSDWYGWRKENQVRYSQRHIWRWRDWTVESINQNKGYDRMIVEMLAGDEVAPGDPDTLRATGYLARSWYRFNRNTWLQEAAEYTSTAFLGLTMKCARCHTHKYDPIAHVDYYRWRAFFEPYDVRTDRVEGQVDTEKAGLVHAYDSDLTAPTYRFIRGNEATPEKDRPLTPGVPSFFNATLTIKPIPIPFDARNPDGREFVYRDLIQAAQKRIETAKSDVAKAQAEVERASVSPPGAPDPNKARCALALAERKLASIEAALPALKARIAADRATQAGGPAADIQRLSEEARALERKAAVLKAEEELYQANQEIEAAKGAEKKLAVGKNRLESAVKALSEATETYTPVGKLYPDTSSGRRLALANWIVSKENPLTARVAINHMWLRHFGKALVPTTFNFGKSGKSPSHPRLLDYLASEFMASGWDMKAMHRLMVTSEAYRMASSMTDPGDNVTIDPDNVYLWRMNVRRMEAEAVRDSLLQIAGKLDNTMGGPEIDETKAEQIFRRSIYFRHTPDLQVDMLSVFDLANPNECFERTESVMPQQALALANSGLGYTIARTLAASLKTQAGTAAFITSAFEKVLGRPATSEEIVASNGFLKQQTDAYRDGSSLTPFSAKTTALVAPSADPEQRGRESLLHVLINHTDFVTIR